MECVAWSPKGDKYASAHARAVTVWDAALDKEVTSIRNLTFNIAAIAFTLCGTKILAVTVKGFISYFEAETGNILVDEMQICSHEHTWKYVHNIEKVWFSQDVERIVVRDGGWYHRGDLKNKRFQMHETTNHTLAFSPDLRIHACVGDHIDHYAHLSNGDGTHKRSPPHERSIHSMVYSPCGTKVASVSGDNQIIVFDPATMVVLMKALRRPQDNRVVELAFTPSGMTFVVGYHDGEIDAHDIALNTRVHISKTENRIRAFAISPTNTSLIVACFGMGDDIPLRFTLPLAEGDVDTDDLFSGIKNAAKTS